MRRRIKNVIQFWFMPSKLLAVEILTNVGMRGLTSQCEDPKNFDLKFDGAETAKQAMRILRDWYNS